MNQQIEGKSNVFTAISKENQFYKQTNDRYKQTVSQTKEAINQVLIMLQQQNKYSFVIEKINAIQNTLIQLEAFVKNKEVLFNQVQQMQQNPQIQYVQNENPMNVNQYEYQPQQQTQMTNQQMMYPVGMYNQQYQNDMNQTQFVNPSQMQQTQMMYHQFNQNDQTNLSRPFLSGEMGSTEFGNGDQHFILIDGE